MSSPAVAVLARLDVALLQRLVVSVDGDVYCHAPADRPFELDALAVPDDGHDRWSSPGTSTIYLAGDPLIAIAEFARHGDPRRSDDRRIVRLRLAPTPVLDLRQRAVAAATGVDPEQCGADRTEARSLSRAVRDAGICAGLVVPSMAFRDDPQRFNVVLFAEAVDSLADRLREATEIGRVTVRGREGPRATGARALGRTRSPVSSARRSAGRPSPSLR